MANDFVRNIKGVRNIDILSPNITTENDLISTTDGNVYVVTKKGYKKITNVEVQDFEKLKTKVDNLNNQSDTNTSDIGDLKTSTDTNTTNIGTLQTDVGTNTTDIGTLQTDVGTNTSEIETLKTSTDTNTSEIETLKTSTDSNTTGLGTLETKTDDNTNLINSLTTELEELRNNTKQQYTLFEGSSNGVGSIIPLNDDLYSFDLIYISGVYPVNQIFTETIMVKSLSDEITIGRTNLKDTVGTFLGAYEIKITVNTGTELEITNDVSWDELGSIGSGADRNAFTITNIEGVK